MHLSSNEKTPYDDKTTLHIASGCKWPAMATIMTVVEEGKMSLNDPVIKYYPTLFANSAV